MSFVPPLSDIRQMMAEAAPDAINLAIGEPVFPAPQGLLDYVSKNVQHWRLGYSENRGLASLRETLADKIYPGFSPEQICITNGAQGALFAACHSLFSAGDEVLVPNPGFLAYGNLVRMTGARPIPYAVPVGASEEMPIADLKKQIGPACKGIILNSPANPTGVSFDAQELASIAGLCEQHNLIAITDEVYRDLYYGAEPPPSIAAFTEKAIVISSISKKFSMTGWRVGWMCGPDEIVSRAVRVQQYIATCTSVPAQYAARYVLEGHVDEDVVSMRETLKQRRDLLAGALKGAKWEFETAEAGLFHFARPAAKPESSFDYARVLSRDYKLICIPGLAFGERGEGFLRLSFAAPEDDLHAAARILESIAASL